MGLREAPLTTRLVDAWFIGVGNEPMNLNIYIEFVKDGVLPYF